MKIKNFTQEQLQAINSDGCSIMVSAAAGSGKTSVLVERLVRLLSNSEKSIFANRIIVVTFTKNSASEMKQRLIKAINQQLEENPNNDWLIKQHSLLQSAKISTIHSFCFDLIRDNIDLLDISSNFKIIEPTEEKIIYLKAIRESIEDMYKSSFDEMLFLTQSLCDKTDNNLEEILFNLYKFLMSIPFFEDWFKSHCIEYYSKSDLQNDEALNTIFNLKIERLKEALSLNNLALELCEKAHDETCYNVLMKDYETIKNTIKILQSPKKYDIPTLNGLLKHKFPNITYDKENVYIDDIKMYRDIYKKLFNDTNSDSIIKINFDLLIDIIQHYQEDKNTNKRVSYILYDLICNIDKKIKALKIEENVLSLSDAEQIAIKLLAKKDVNGNIVKTELAEDLSNYYQIIMVDEFQDSNNNQDLIFKMLSKNGTAEKMGNNIFVVGDVKQAIYNFRLANPQNFIDVMKYSKPYVEKNPPENSYIKLNQNFRSSREVIDFVNYTFENLMSETVGEVVYNDNEKLIYGANYLPSNRSTEIPLIDSEKFSEAEYIARTIKSMIDNKYPVFERDGTVRNCRLSDFCMLFMATKDIPEYFEKLQEFGLNASFDQDDEFLKSREVSLLINMVKIVNNPMDNIALVSIMMSPIFMFTPDDVATIRLINRDSSIYSSMLEVYKDTQHATYPKDLVTKVTYAVDTLSLLRNLSANCTIYELMTNIIDITDLISIMQVYDTSNKRRLNLQILLKVAQKYDETSTTGITGFIRYINSMLDNKQDLNIKINNATNDSINIKTIHKSKGLEFPFVFLCNADKQFNEQDINLDVIQNSSKYGIAYKLKDRKSFLYYNTADFLRVSYMKRIEERSEKMRLMYVALTRAKEKLFIPLSFKKDKTTIQKILRYINIIKYEGNIPDYLVKDCVKMEDWLLMLLCCCDKSKPIRDFFEIPVDEDFALECNANINMYIYNPDMTNNQPIENVNDTIFNVDESLKQNILYHCNFKYVNQKADLPARISVSNIVKSDSINIKVSTLNAQDTTPQNESQTQLETFDSLRMPNFINSTNLTPAEKGTAIHKVMQYCDFNNLKIDTHNEVQRLLNEGYLTIEQSKVIEYSMFTKLINSDIFQLITDNKIQRERNFLVKVSELNIQNESIDIYKDTDTMLQGCVDMIVFEPDGITIIDYKTDNVYSMNILKERYSLQIQLYKSAIELIENTKVKKSIIYSMKLGKYIEI